MDGAPPIRDLRPPAGPLALEERQDFADQAVTGGLGRFMVRWTEARQAATGDREQSPLTALRALFLGYEGLAPAQRREHVLKAREILGTLASTAPQAPPPEADRPPEPAPSALSPEQAAAILDAPVTTVHGVSGARQELLANLGIQTVRDLLHHYPTRHEDRRRITAVTELRHGTDGLIAGEIAGPGESRRVRKRLITQVPLRDKTGVAFLTWFNQQWREGQFSEGQHVVACGPVKVFQGRPSLQTPECERVGRGDTLHMRRIVPIHALTKGLFQPQLRRIVYDAVQRYARFVPDCLPPAVRERESLLDAATALRQLHFPEDLDQLERARKRIVFEELFLLQTELARVRQSAKDAPGGIAFDIAPGLLDEFRSALPFTLTEAQERVIAEVAADMADPRPANRLIHGEVGAGKTVVAAYAMLVAARNGYQAAVMVPTEILAEQHHETLAMLMQPLGLEPALLTGSLRAAARAEVLEGLETGALPLVVGTHALIQESVTFGRLGLAVVDEQHRFGVLQRAELRDKAECPDVLVMTATPIPRTLALTVYGDFDISRLDELPPGRQPCDTQVLTLRQRPKAYEFVRERVAEGRQAYVVCPLVEESEKLELQAATEAFERLQAKVFPELSLALVHGRLGTAERQAAMEGFRRGEAQVLVSTTVIEVGVDVVNATVMVVENAERFGLSQLHQLRGRVRRGSHPAFCLLLAGSRSEDAWERLNVLARTDDGFEVAEEDLRMRGPGEFYGTRQHGLPDLKMADIIGDTATLIQAREIAFELIKADPELTNPEHQLLKRQIRQRVSGRMKLVDVS